MKDEPSTKIVREFAFVLKACKELLDERRAINERSIAEGEMTGYYLLSYGCEAFVRMCGNDFEGARAAASEHVELKERGARHFESVGQDQIAFSWVSSIVTLEAAVLGEQTERLLELLDYRIQLQVDGESALDSITPASLLAFQLLERQEGPAWLREVQGERLERVARSRKVSKHALLAMHDFLDLFHAFWTGESDVVLEKAPDFSKSWRLIPVDCVEGSPLPFMKRFYGYFAKYMQTLCAVASGDMNAAHALGEQALGMQTEALDDDYMSGHGPFLKFFEVLGWALVEPERKELEAFRQTFPVLWEYFDEVVMRPWMP